MSCVWMLQRGHSGDGCVLASTLCKYDLRKGDLFVLSWARVRRVRRGSISSELLVCGGGVRSILLLPLVARCLETIDVCIFRELGCSIHDSLPFIPRALVNHKLQTVQGNSRKSLYNQEHTLNTLISKITISKLAMDTLVDTNHINELAALQNLIKIFDVDTTMEKEVHPQLA